MVINFCVFVEEDKVRVDMYLATLFPLFSRSYIQKLLKEKQVLVN
jgi:23S rRNA-/tRNA-specific pseudouridylate synthase